MKADGLEDRCFHLPEGYDPLERYYWLSAWNDLAADASAGWYASLLARYAEPQRHYHTMQHLAECFAHYDNVAGLCQHAGEVLLALWFHDAVYDPHSQGNEEASAALAKSCLAEGKTSNAVISRIAALILATRHSAPPTTSDQAILVDIDLAILGATPGRFAEYEGQIRREYAWVPEDKYRSARRQVLEGFLARRYIYYTTYFRSTFEAPARANLAQTLTGLTQINVDVN